MRTVIAICRGHKTRRVPKDANGLTPTIWFDSWRLLAGVLSDQIRELLRLIRDREPRTVMELAELSGRAASNLSRTLQNLVAHGLVRLHRSHVSCVVFLVVLVFVFL